MVEVIKNRTHTLQATLTNDGAVWDISTATEIYFTVATIEGASGVINHTLGGGEIAFATDGSDGVINITVDNSDTASLSLGGYVFGIDVTIGGETYQALCGIFTIIAPVMA